MHSPVFRACLCFSLVVASPFTVPAQTAHAEGAAHAQVAKERPLDDTLQGAAKDAYVSAKILFNNNDFEGAATKYGQAYELSKDPRLLFNFAVCEKNLRHYARTQGLLQQYEAEMGGRIPADDKATVDAALAAIKNLVGSVTLTVTEAGASVAVDGAPVGMTPLATPLRLDLGKHAVVVKKAGFVTAERVVEVSGGNETVATVALVAETHDAHLLILTDAEAVVAIDEKAVSKGRFDGKVPPGVHTVQVTEAGKAPYRSEIELKNDETRSLSVALENEKRAIPWVWIGSGAAVLVAGASLGGYFLFRGQSEAAAPPDKLGSVQLKGRR